MRHRHALGCAGGAGGVHHIRGGADRHGDVWRWRGAGVVVESGHGQAEHACRSERIVGPLDQHLGLCIGDQCAQTLVRMRAIQRHVGCRALEHGQLRDDQLDRTRQRDGHVRARAQAQCVQPLRQSVGLRIERGVVQAALRVDHGDGIGRALRLRFEQPVQRLCRHGGGRAAAEVRQHLVPLWRIQPRQLRNMQVFCLGQRVQDLFEAMPPALNGRRIEERGGIAQTADDASAILLQREFQIELADGEGAVQAFQSQIGQFQRDAGGVLPGEHDLEQRRVGEAADGIERFDHLLEGDVLMVLRGERGGAHLREQLGDGWIRAQVQMQCLRVDEQADQRFQFAAGAVGGRGADHDPILAGQACQQHAPGGQQGHEHGGAVALAQLAQGAAECSIEGDLVAAAAVVLHGRTRVIGGQFQQCRRVVQMRAPEIQLPLQQRPIEPAALPHGVIRILNR